MNNALLATAKSNARRPMSNMIGLVVSSVIGIALIVGSFVATGGF